MNTIHDLGGLDGLTIPERDQGRVLKEEWERQVWGMTITSWSKPIPGYTPFSRVNIESIPPAAYLRMPYYAKWLYVLEGAMLRSGVVTKQELDDPDGEVSMPDSGNFVPATPADVFAFGSADDSEESPADAPPKFREGDAVLVRNEHPKGHTRMPRYLRGHRGVVHKHHGVHRFQDEVKEDVGQQHIYTVKFTGPELWGSRAHPNDVIYAELWDYHLEADS